MSRQRVRAVGVCLASLCVSMSIVATPAQADTGNDAILVASSRDFSEESLFLSNGAEFSGLKQVSQPWYVARFDGGKKTVFVWGPGAKDVKTSQLDGRGRIKSASSSRAAAAATCRLEVATVGYGSDKLLSSTLVRCSSTGGISTEALFQRRNTIFIWVGYGGTSRSGTRVGTSQALNWNQVCNNGDNKLWNYRLRARSYTSVAGTSAWYNGVPNQFFCGT